MKKDKDLKIKDNIRLEKGWLNLLKNEFKKEYFINLKRFILQEKQKTAIYPPGGEIFNAFELCPWDRVRVVVLGQDPYHGENQAHGLCFSVNKGIRFPPSLKNIFKELESDLNILPPESGNLENWAKQGVLLLNATLTVSKGQPGSHFNQGWEIFTDAVVDILNNNKQGLVFLLWGRHAQKKGAVIDEKKHFVLKAPHPSPFSAHNGFFGCKHFSRTNEYLLKQGREPIDWEL